jgi:lysine 2,3-aminomutase
VLLRGVNDEAMTLIALVKALGRVNIHPYYVYLCDMVTSTEHFRLPLGTAQRLEKAVRGATAGFNTPLFVCDAPGGGGKRDVHSAELYDEKSGVSAFRSPSIDPDRTYHYFDPLRALDPEAREAWRAPGARERILGQLGLLPAASQAAE